MHGVYFNMGSAQLLPESGPAIEKIAALLKAQPAWTITIEGHTDNIGAADYNLNLSRARASAVRDTLIAQYGITEARLTSAGYGATRPVESNTTIEGRARNRRVELSRKCQ
jgi:outer membrane protein OmpA-like peptidoglycan-associated protein